MEPIGTITMYYPFLEEEIVATLDTIIHEAEDYHDFVSRLGRKVCTEEVPVTLTYLAAVHAQNIGSSEIRAEILFKHGDLTTIKAWVTDDINSRTIAIDEVLSSDLDNWIEIELHYLKTQHPDFRDHLGSLVSFDKSKELLETDAKLRCFESRILTIEGIVKRIEGDIHGAILNFKEGLNIATEFDDRVRVTDLLLSIGNLTKDINAKESWELFDKAHRSAKSIGYHRGVGAALLEMGKVSYIRGEYDLAIQSLLESDNIYSSVLLSEDPSVSIQLSRALCAAGDGEEALTWADVAINRTQTTVVFGHLQKAQSLILLGKTGDALEQLDLGKTLALKEGREWDLAQYYFVNGLYENAIGNSLNGIMSLEQSIEIIDRINLGILKGQCLIALTKAEMSIYDVGGDSDTSGPWMSRLQEYAREKDLPGILMEQALLKAEFQAEQSRVEAARKTLVDALSIYDSPSVASLRNKIRERISDLDLSMQSDIA